MQGHHNCSTELRVATLPVQKPFWYSLFPHERPKRGFPKSTRTVRQSTVEEKQTTDTLRERSTSRNRSECRPRSEVTVPSGSRQSRSETVTTRNTSTSSRTVTTSTATASASSASYEKRQVQSPELHRSQKSRRIAETTTTSAPTFKFMSSTVSQKTSKMTQRVHRSPVPDDTESELDYDESMLEISFEQPATTSTSTRTSTTTATDEQDSDSDTATEADDNEQQEDETTIMSTEDTSKPTEELEVQGATAKITDTTTKDKTTDKIQWLTDDEVAMPKFNELAKLQFPILRENTSTYRLFRRNYRSHPDEYQRGILIFAEDVYPRDTNTGHEYYTIHILNGVGCGTFYITNVDGYPVAKACITSHSSLPTPETTLYNQFNPYNFPVYSELINTRFQPHAVTHFITLNTALDIGYYRLVHTQFKATSKTYMFYIQKHKGKFGEESVLQRKK